MCPVGSVKIDSRQVLVWPDIVVYAESKTDNISEKFIE